MTETEIIAGCKKDKRRCQKALVDKYAPTLFTVARRYTRDDHTAKDILQEALHLIFKNIHKVSALLDHHFTKSACFKNLNNTK